MGPDMKLGLWYDRGYGVGPFYLLIYQPHKPIIGADYGREERDWLRVPGGKKEYQVFVERSQQTDDNEFYILQIERCVNLKEFYFRALRWQFMYNTRRHHSIPGMTPYRKLRTQMQISK